MPERHNSLPLNEAHEVVDTGRELTIRAARRGFGPQEALCRCAKEEASDVPLLSHGKRLRRLTGEVTLPHRVKRALQGKLDSAIVEKLLNVLWWTKKTGFAA